MAVLRWLATGLLCAPAIAAAAVIPDDSAQIPLAGLHDAAGTSTQSQSQSQSQSQRKLRGRFLHITDFHPDEYYKPRTSTEEGVACHRGHGVAGKYGAETTDCDTPMSLVNATFDWLAANVRDQIDFVIWTGDSARHDSDEKIPRSPAQVLGTNRIVADKFKSTFTHPEGDAVPIPVIPTFGNNDILPHNVLLPGPNQWLSYYTDIWKAFIPEEQVHSFEFGGWFYVETIPGKLAVFSLNTLYFFDRNAGIDDCAHPSEPGFKQLEWLKVQLGFLRRRGMKAILMGHVPPARTESKMLWDETCWQKYTLWLQQYRDVVVSGIYGHMNIDHFLIQDTKELNIAMLQGKVTKEEVGAKRVPLDDELSINSAADYLQELRTHWRDLETSKVKVNEFEDDNANEDGEDFDDEEDEDDFETDNTGRKKKKKKGRKGRKGKKRKSPWGERYQISLVGPSIVPNYFPTIRIIEYNITGLEHATVWADRPQSNDEYHDSGKGKEKKGKKGKKPKHPKDPYLIIPDPPAKTAPPGPAYSAQTLSLTGYTQYYANLTHINNDFIVDKEDNDEDDEVHNLKKWRNGKHHGKTPKKDKDTHKFEFQVEYSTFNDSLYCLADLTVNSYVDLAYRMGQKTAHKRQSVDLLDDAADEDPDDPLEATKKKKKKKKKQKHNEVWLHFLRHAFVRTVDERELKKLDRPQ